VYLGFSEFPSDVYLNTVPVYLYPGSQIFGQAEMVYRDVLEDSYILILGVPSVSPQRISHYMYSSHADSIPQYRRILIARISSWPVEDNGIVPLPNNNTGKAKISPLRINPVRYERGYLTKSISEVLQHLAVSGHS
jgi:hypothetical protein